MSRSAAGPLPSSPLASVASACSLPAWPLCSPGGGNPHRTQRRSVGNTAHRVGSEAKVNTSRWYRGALVASAAIIVLAQGAALGATASPSRVSQPIQATKGDDDP